MVDSITSESQISEDDFYRALAGLGIGREAVVIAKKP